MRFRAAELRIIPYRTTFPNLVLISTDSMAAFSAY